MGLYPINCRECGHAFLWFSGNLDQRCGDCRKADIKPDIKPDIKADTPPAEPR